MNIFWLDLCLRICAQYHCDRHVCKMLIEVAQLLYTSQWELGRKRWYRRCEDAIDAPPYRKTHVNHPCAIWVRESRSNYRELAKLGLELCKEYTRRYGKVHKTEKHLKWLRRHPPKHLKDTGPTPKRMAMPDQYKTEGDPVKSYRDYYMGEKRHIAVWSSTPTPNWWK